MYSIGWSSRYYVSICGIQEISVGDRICCTFAEHKLMHALHCIVFMFAVFIHAVWKGIFVIKVYYLFVAFSTQWVKSVKICTGIGSLWF